MRTFNTVREVNTNYLLHNCSYNICDIDRWHARLVLNVNNRKKERRRKKEKKREKRYVYLRYFTRFHDRFISEDIK